MRKYANKIDRKMKLTNTEHKPYGVAYSINCGEEYLKQYAGNWLKMNWQNKYYNLHPTIFRLDYNQYPYIALDFRYTREKIKHDFFGSRWEEYPVKPEEVLKTIQDVVMNPEVKPVLYENLDYRGERIFRIIIPIP